MPGIETKQAIVYCHGADFRMHVNPALKAAYIYDNSQTGASKWIDKTLELQDRAAVGTGTSMDSFTTSDRLFLCFSDVTGGFYVTVNAANSTGNDMSCKYWNGSAWTTLSETDNTDTGASLAASGAVTWTTPTDALMTTLGGPHNIYGKPFAQIDSGLTTNEALDATETGVDMSADPSSTIVAGDLILVEYEVMYVNSSNATGTYLNVIRGFLGSTAASHTTGQTTYIYNNKCPFAGTGFWVEVSWGAGMDSDTEIGEIWALNKNSNRGFFHAGVEYPISFDRRNVGAIEAVISAGGAVLDVYWLRTII
jgi:hypothetical protein